MWYSRKTAIYGNLKRYARSHTHTQTHTHIEANQTRKVNKPTILLQILFLMEPLMQQNTVYKHNRVS